MSRRHRKAGSKRSQPDAPGAVLQHRILPIVIIIALSLLAMGRLCGHDFANWDDNHTVSDNPVFNPPTLKGVMSYWRQPFMDLYVPVTYMVWGVAATVSYNERTGLNPHVFHTFNVLLHAANAVLVFVLLQRLLPQQRTTPGAPTPRAAWSLERPGIPTSTWAPLAGAALFAVHPVQVETVGWVSGMKDLLCGFLVLLALWGYVAFAQSSTAQSSTERPRAGWKYYALGTFAFVLALLAKPTAVVTPVMAAIIDRMAVGRRWRSILLAVGPWMLLAIPCVIWTRKFQAAEHLTAVPPLWLRPLVALDALAFYLAKLVWPASLAIDYGRTPEVAIRQGWVYLTWIAPLALAILLWLVRRRVPRAAAGAALTLAGLLPILGLVPFDFQQYSTVADHYLYLPMVGVALGIAAVLATQPLRRWVVPFGAIVLILCIRSIVQTGHWRDSMALMRHTIAVNPYSWASYKSLAAALLDEGATDEALSAARKAVELNPRDAGAFGSVGAVLGAKGMLAEAEGNYLQALTLEPDSSSLLAQLAGVVAKQGRTDEAIPIASRALAIDPQNLIARQNLGTMRHKQGDLEGAASEFAIWAALSPRDPQAHTYLGLVLADLRRFDAAVHHLKLALRLDPASAQARDALARLDAMSRSPHSAP